MLVALLTLAFFAGLAALSYGAWLAYEPAGFMVAGTALTVVPLLYARGRRWASSTQ